MVLFLSAMDFLVGSFVHIDWGKFNPIAPRMTIKVYVWSFLVHWVRDKFSGAFICPG